MGWLKVTVFLLSKYINEIFFFRHPDFVRNCGAIVCICHIYLHNLYKDVVNNFFQVNSNKTRHTYVLQWNKYVSISRSTLICRNFLENIWRSFFKKVFANHPRLLCKKNIFIFIHLPIYLSIYLFIYLSICIYGESFISYNLIAFWNRPFLDNIFKSVDLMS